MKLNKFVSAFLLIVSSFGITANAYLKEVEYIPTSGIAAVRGTLSENQNAFLTVLKNGNDDFFFNIIYQGIINDFENGMYEKKI